MMNWLRAATVLGVLAGPVLSGGRDTVRREDVVKSMLAAMGSLTKTLIAIQDEPTARAARNDLKKAADEWRALRKKADSLPPPSTAEAAELSKQYGTKLKEASKVLFSHIARVQQIPGGNEVLGDIAKVFAPDKKTPP